VEDGVYACGCPGVEIPSLQLQTAPESESGSVGAASPAGPGALTVSQSASSERFPELALLVQPRPPKSYQSGSFIVPSSAHGELYRHWAVFVPPHFEPAAVSDAAPAALPPPSPSADVHASIAAASSGPGAAVGGLALPAAMEAAAAQTLHAERAFVRAWAAACADAGGGDSGSAPPACPTRVRSCGLVAASPLAAFALRTGSLALVLQPPPGEADTKALAKRVALAAAATQVARGGAIDGVSDKVVAVGFAPLQLLAGFERHEGGFRSSTFAEALFAGVEWQWCAADPALRSALDAWRLQRHDLSLVRAGAKPPALAVGYHLPRCAHSLTPAARGVGGGWAATLDALWAQDGALVLVQLQMFDDENKLVIDTPGGGRSAGETSLGCALREADEEAGLRLPLDLSTAEGTTFMEVGDVRLNATYLGGVDCCCHEWCAATGLEGMWDALHAVRVSLA
jgi:hypothetical protein